MHDFSKDILQTIEKKHIKPLPQWVFFARQASLIGTFLLSVIIGGISVSVILFSVSEVADVGMGRMMRMHPGPFLLTYLPYVWVAALIVFGVAAYVEMRHTKAGYRYRTATILGASFLASLLLGGSLHAVGAGQFVDRGVADVVPQYRGLDARKEALWMRPQEGMLAGRIVSGAATTTFVLEDLSGRRWVVEGSDAVVRGPIENISEERVRAAGSVVRPGVFRATDLFPWGGQGKAGMPAGMRGVPQRPNNKGMLMRERNRPAKP